MSNVNTFNSMCNILPLNAKINFSINNENFYMNSITYSYINNYITITLLPRNYEDRYLYDINNLIKNSNINDTTNIFIHYSNNTYVINNIDTNNLTNGNIKFHLIATN